MDTSTRPRETGAHVSRRVRVLDTGVDAYTIAEAVDRVMSWAREGGSRAVVLCNVHVAVTAQSNRELRSAVSSADMVLPDGAPIAWMLRRLGRKGQRRTAGPDVMWETCRQCEMQGVGVYLYGGREETLRLLRSKLACMFPRLQIVGSESPPFRDLSEAEDSATVEAISRSAAGVVLVGLGCPKQERWIAAHRGRVHAVMLGVGAAFDFHAGVIRRAPQWVQRVGAEWLYRLLQEPGRLWKRYLTTNSAFAVRALCQLVLRHHRENS